MFKFYSAVERYSHNMFGARSWAASCTVENFKQLKDRFPLQRPEVHLPYGRLRTYAAL
jgi:hypothetical protein